MKSSILRLSYIELGEMKAGERMREERKKLFDGAADSSSQSTESMQQASEIRIHDSGAPWPVAAKITRPTSPPSVPCAPSAPRSTSVHPRACTAAYGRPACHQGCLHWPDLTTRPQNTCGSARVRTQIGHDTSVRFAPLIRPQNHVSL